MFGNLPTEEELVTFCEFLSMSRELPQYFADSSVFKLTEAIIPSTVNYVDQKALAAPVLYFKSTVPPLMPERTVSGGYDPPGSNQTIYVPSQSVAAYKSAAGWSLYADRIVGYDY